MDRDQPDTTRSVQPQRSSRTVRYFFALVAGTILGIVLLDSALLFPHGGLAYQWLNRIGVFLGLLFTLGFFVGTQWYSMRPSWDGSRANTWAVRAFSLIIPLAFVVKLWGRILEAFWLR